MENLDDFFAIIPIHTNLFLLDRHQNSASLRTLKLTADLILWLYRRLAVQGTSPYELPIDIALYLIPLHVS